MYRIEVALPVPLARNFTYISKTLVARGLRVRVPFGVKKLIGVCLGPASERDLGHIVLKEIEEVLDEAPILSENLLDLAYWLSQYYLHPLGLVFKTMLPNYIPTHQEAILEKPEPTSYGGQGEFLLPELNAEQSKALQEIKTFDKSKIFLLHGVTGSGKTRVYISTIVEMLQRFGTTAQALVLVPEIALTPQITQIFEDGFPGKIAVVHSALSDKKRWKELLKIRDGKASILIGARSAIFASFRNLKLIIVDEEHDQSYKQHSGLTYNARDLAVVRTKKERITCILGSATPSVESYWNTELGKYRLLELKSRALDANMPKVDVISNNSKMAREKIDSHDLENSFLTPLAIQALQDNLEQKKQAILLVNRRGYAYYLFNEETKTPIECPRCSISLTVHKKKTLLICHYCAYQTTFENILAQFPSANFTTIGVGSQKAEAFLKQTFPHARIARLDSDVLTSRKNLFSILTDFKNGDIDILIGTQILAKGHDFPNVTLTIICELDQMLDLPDFRAGERTFQLLVQSGGRAGRSTDSQGKVLIQSSRSQSRILTHALEHDYKSFIREEIELRKNYAYPPFQHLIRIEITSVFQETLNLFCADISSWQKSFIIRHPDLVDKTRILGPLIPPIEKINKRYRRALLLSSKNSETVHQVAYEFLKAFPLRSRDIRIQIDVDPQSLL